MHGSIAVIGGGILGLFTAWELAQRGPAVTLFDAGPLAGGTSGGGSFAWLNATSKHAEPSYHRLNRAGMARYAALARRFGDAALGLSPGGCLHWASPADGAQLAALRAQFRALLALDYPATWLDAAALALHEPAVRFSAQAEGFVTPADRWADTQRLLRFVAGQAERAGARLRFSAPVTVAQAAHGFSVTAGGEAAAFDRLVIAAGHRTAALAAPLQQARGVNAAWSVAADPGMFARLPAVAGRPAHILYCPGPAGLHMRPTPDGGLLVGSDAADQALRDGGNPAALLPELLSQARTVLLAELSETATLVTGTRALPQDGVSVVGALPGVAGAFVLVTHSGITLAPHLALMLAEQIAGGGPGLPDYAPTRYGSSTPPP